MQHAVGAFFHLRAHLAQLGRDRGDAIRFLDAQLGGFPDHGRALSLRRRDGEDREFVDGAHDQVAVGVGGAQRAGVDDEVGEGLTGE